MSEAKRKTSPFLKQCFVTGSVCSNIAGHGCIMGFPAILLPQLREKDSSIVLTEENGSWIVSTLGIMILIGNFMTPPIMEKLGRKPAHLAVTIPIILGWLITIFANGFKALLIGRILQALSYGMMLPLGSVLVGECTSPKNRGAFLMIVTLAQAFGIFLVHLVGSLLSWRKTGMICIIFSFASLLMIIYSPETPSWLAAKGKYDESKKVFRWLRGDSEEEELEEMIRARVITEKSKADSNKVTISSLVNVLKKREFYIPIVLMIHANAMMQFAGGPTMAAYSTTLIGLILGPSANAHFWMVALDAQRLVSNTIAVYIINKIKRRTMMFLTGGICILSHIAIAGYVYAKLNGMVPDSIWIPALLINLQFFSVATGMVPLPNVIAGEVFPLEYRGIGGSISVISVAAFVFVVLKTFPGLVACMNLYGTYLVYAAVLTYNLVVIWFLLPETKDRTLQQIEDEFKGKKIPSDLEDGITTTNSTGDCQLEDSHLIEMKSILTNDADKQTN